MTDKLQSALCDMQGQLFEMSVARSLDSATFVRAFMLSAIAKDLDSTFNYMQWAGKEYIMERILDELGAELQTGGEVYDLETMYWAGYIYRYWHYYTGETSKEIYKQAPVKTMRVTFLAYHTMSAEMAIDRLKDSYRQKHLQ